jgi:periplasmic divalent cation tolerance protein
VNPIQVTTTVDSREAAATIARGAVEARLAACAQVCGPITSVYHWQGAIETAEEWTVAFKTTTERYAALEAHVKQHHSYDLPEIVAVALTGSDAYLDWVRAEVGQPAG